MGMDHKLIPWEAVQKFAEDFNKDVMVIVAFDSTTNLTDIATWGKTLAQSEFAAESGNKLKIALAWPPKACISISAKTQQVLDQNIALFTALLEAKKTIRNWHGGQHWDIYDSMSPEMNLINNAINNAAGGEV